jgi:DNA repair photolyase
MNDKNKNPLRKVKGRGTASNVTSRFDQKHTEIDLADYGYVEEDDFVQARTEFIKDSTRTIVNHNNSPDIGFTYSVNPYRGCEHGCAYCYARPTHEYLGMSAGLDFETKIFYKENAAELLREKFMSKNWKAETISISGVTDCYQPVERKFKLTRSLLEVLRDFKNPVGLITKNELITRDVDILGEMAKDNLACAFLSVTTLDDDLARKLEPRTSSPQGRLRAIETLAKAGVKVGVMVAPCIPGLTDHEMPSILKAARDAGAQWAGYVPVRLPHSVKDIFSDWLETHRPERKEKVLNAIRDIRDGKLNDGNFETRMQGFGPRADNMNSVFDLFTKKLGFNQYEIGLSKDKFQRPGDQIKLF